MKKLFISFLLMFTVSLGFSSNPTTLIIEDLTTDVVDFKVYDVENLKLFASIEYLEETQNIVLKTVDNIDFIKVVNAEDEIEFVMPVASNSLHLFMQDFEVGEYDVYLTIDEFEIQTKMYIK